MPLEEKTILVTGASRGIGKEIVKLLASEWAQLILVARSSRHLKSLTKELVGHHLVISADLTTKKGLNKVVRTINKKVKSLDVIVNNAGIGIYKPFAKITEKDWDNSYALNVKAPYFLAQSLLPLMTKSSGSLVLNIGSCSALQNKPERSLYNATKAALRSLTLCLEKEYKSGRPEFCHITLDSTLTSFGPLSVAEKKTQSKLGREYLSPVWVSQQIVNVIKSDSRSAEYVLSPHCFKDCGVWVPPSSAKAPNS